MNRTLVCAMFFAACDNNNEVVQPDGAVVVDVRFLDASDVRVEDQTVRDVLSDTFSTDERSTTDVTAETTCSGSNEICGSSCVDTLSNPMHCGGCDVRCTAMSPDCVCGRCVLGCATGFIGCCRTGPGSGDACFNPMTSNEHCGTCGTRCTGGAVCVMGRCESSLVDCDPRRATCSTSAPTCSTGEYPRVEASCWNGCVPLVRCAPIPCGAGQMCPTGWRCNASTSTCTL
jgi:hypothetical protein